MKGRIGTATGLVRMRKRQRNKLYRSMEKQSNRVIVKRQETKANAVKHFDPTPRLVKKQ